MGHLISRSKEIEALRFVKLGTKPMKAKRVFRRGHITVVELESGALWSPQVSGKYAYTPSRGNHIALLQLLVDLGRIQKAELEVHLKHVAAVEAEAEKRDQRQSFLRMIKKMGLKPSAEQKKALKIQDYELSE